MQFGRSKDKALGVSPQKRRYDLPLNESGGTGFVRLLIALMSFLTLFALTAQFVLTDITQRWSAGVQNHMTIEIPAQDRDGEILAPETVRTLSEDAQKQARAHPAVEEATLLSTEEIAQMVAPWLGDDLTLEGDNAFPLPGLVTVILKEGQQIDANSFESQLKTLNNAIRLDTHESWLETVLRFTGALQFAALFITLTVISATIIVIATAVTSKMTIHKQELELLHLMGAQDPYITRQFQRHSFILAFQGAVLGCALGAVILTIIGQIGSKMDIALVPDFALNGHQMIVLAALPFAISILAMGTARMTVLRHLRKMP